MMADVAACAEQAINDFVTGTIKPKIAAMLEEAKKEAAEAKKAHAKEAKELQKRAADAEKDVVQPYLFLRYLSIFKKIILNEKYLMNNTCQYLRKCYSLKNEFEVQLFLLISFNFLKSIGKSCFWHL